MSSHTHDPAAPIGQKLLLVDFDWRDADLLPELFLRADVSVRLVVGNSPQDPGWKVAEVCGLPRTLDLADLTREIFDLALVGERSSRRARVQSLLEALRTPCLTPREFLAIAGPAAETATSSDKPAGRDGEPGGGAGGDRNGNAAAGRERADTAPATSGPAAVAGAQTGRTETAPDERATAEPAKAEPARPE